MVLYGGSIQSDIASTLIDLLLSALPIPVPVKKLIDLVKMIPGVGDAFDLYLSWVQNAIANELRPLSFEELRQYQETHKREISEAEKYKAQRLAELKRQWAEIDRKFNTPQKRASNEYLRLKTKYETEFKKYGGRLVKKKKSKIY